MSDEPECIHEAAALLGEGPVWDEGQLYWVDIEGKSIHRWQDGERDEFAMPERIGHVAVRRSGGLVVGLQTGFHFVELEPLTIRPLNDPEPELTNNRFNDGKCDRHGRLWAGTMDCDQRQATGALYRLDPERIRVVPEGIRSVVDLDDAGALARPVHVETARKDIKVEKALCPGDDESSVTLHGNVGNKLSEEWVVVHLKLTTLWSTAAVETLPEDAR